MPEVLGRDRPDQVQRLVAELGTVDRVEAVLGIVILDARANAQHDIHSRVLDVRLEVAGGEQVTANHDTGSGVPWASRLARRRRWASRQCAAAATGDEQLASPLAGGGWLVETCAKPTSCVIE